MAAEGELGGIAGWRRALQRLAAIRWVTSVVAPMVYAIDPAILRLSRDRHSLTSLAIGLPVHLIATTGARTGQSRTLPLTTVPNGSGMALIASNFGRPQLPGWCHNLRSHPFARVRLHGEWRRFAATEVHGEERQPLWALAVALYPGYADYARRAAPRPVPVFLLTPDEDPA